MFCDGIICFLQDTRQAINSFPFFIGFMNFFLSLDDRGRFFVSYGCLR